MVKDTQQLITCLNMQKKLYAELLELSIKKRQIIIDDDANLLGDIVEKEKELIDKINVEEEVRCKLTDSIAQQSNIDGAVNLTKIINVVDSENKLVLSNLLKDLDSILKNLKQNNAINHDLIQTQLHYINMIKNVFIASDQRNYDINGKEVKGQTQTINIFDRMV